LVCDLRVVAKKGRREEAEEDYPFDEAMEVQDDVPKPLGRVLNQSDFQRGSV